MVKVLGEGRIIQGLSYTISPPTTTSAPCSYLTQPTCLAEARRDSEGCIGSKKSHAVLLKVWLNPPSQEQQRRVDEDGTRPNRQTEPITQEHYQLQRSRTAVCLISHSNFSTYSRLSPLRIDLSSMDQYLTHSGD